MRYSGQEMIMTLIVPRQPPGVGVERGRVMELGWRYQRWACWASHIEQCVGKL